jgi:hypothetical protein
LNGSINEGAVLKKEEKIFCEDCGVEICVKLVNKDEGELCEKCDQELLASIMQCDMEGEL